MSSHHLTAIDDAAWESPWRHRRCGEKVALSLGLIVTALVLPPWPTCLLVAIASVVLVVGWARIPARVLATVMLAPTAFILLGAATVVVQVGVRTPDALWRCGWLSVTGDSLVRGLGAGAHGLAGTLAVMVLATTTPLVDVLTWLRTLRVPAPLLEIASLTYRLIFVVLQTLLAVREAQTNRLGYERGGRYGGWERPVRSTGTLMGHVLTRAWHRATRLEEGLSLRGDMEHLMTLARPRAVSWPLVATAVALPVLLVLTHLVVNR